MKYLKLIAVLWGGCFLVMVIDHVMKGGRFSETDVAMFKVIMAVSYLVIFLVSGGKKASLALRKPSPQSVQVLSASPRKVVRAETLKPMQGIITQAVKNSKQYLQ